ncbi:MAG: fatty acid desaturase [Drouetiella hepatica Uher 2000/2452]|jgi:fatty acid desaturase|uniref:Fatty acid desaturase n=1 Tax=Drouetiella hepatica Uher 2000/2452 TaxID=904376 RepID=A0A951QA23_9CYAN|nr:fatty acid desaturase [Drouetiella hepatica Uher 2000/2452]
MDQLNRLKTLRSLLPKEAFIPDSGKLVILVINLLIFIAGLTIARDLDQWSLGWLWLYLPLAIVMGNSVVVLLFSSHDLLHGSVIKNPRLAHFISLFGLALLWMPPTLWKVVHNQKHHTQTNAMDDPDRSYLLQQSQTWGKWIQNLVVPSAEVNSFYLILGMATAWGTHTFRHLTSVLQINPSGFGPTPIASNANKRKMIAGELLIIALAHFSILAYLKFSFLSILLGYLMPIWIGYAGVMFYIYTNHFLCPMTEINDPFFNSLSIKVYKFFDLLHFNFSYHTEHHFFPSINSDYYPLLRNLILTHYPNRLNLLTAGDAWQSLLNTPRHYKDQQTLTDWSGNKSVICPCVSEPAIASPQRTGIKETA